MRFLLCLCFAGLLSQIQPSAQVNVTASPEIIASGDTAKLTWKVVGFARAYILGHGPVDLEGTITVRPTKTTDYLLLAEGSHGTVSKMVHIEVKGSRGGEASCQQEADSFKYPVRFERQVNSVIDEMDRVYHILQDDLAFSVQASQMLNKPDFILLTNCSQRGNLVGASEARIGARRVSYRLNISTVIATPNENVESSPKSSRPDPRSAMVTYEIQTLVQYRRRIESTWRTEDQEDIYRNAARDLQNRIASLSRAN